MKQINSIQGGISPTRNTGTEHSYLGACAIDPDEKINLRIGGAISPVNYEASGASGAMWLEPNDVNDNVYYYDKDGNFGIQDGATIDTVSGSSGNGLAYYNNYYYIATNTNVHRYGPLDSSATMDYNWWSSQAGLKALGNKEYDTVGNTKLPNHTMHVHGDSSLYLSDCQNNQGRIHRLKCVDLLELSATGESFTIGEIVTGADSGAQADIMGTESTIDPVTYTASPGSNRTPPWWVAMSGTGWTNPANAYTEDGTYATTDSGTEAQCYYNFDMGLTGGAEIVGVEVRVKAKTNYYTSGAKLQVAMTVDADDRISGTYSDAVKDTGQLTTTNTWYTLGGPNETWGRAWTSGEVNATGFGISNVKGLLHATSGSTDLEYQLDAVEIKVYTGGTGKLKILNTLGTFTLGESVAGTTTGTGTITSSSKGNGVLLTDTDALSPLSNRFYPVAIDSFGTDLMIVANDGNRSALFLWDTVDSSFYKEIHLPYKRATGLKVHNGTPYIFGGDDDGYSVSVYTGGDTVQPLHYIDNGLPPVQGAIDAKDHRLAWGSSQTYPEARGCIWAFGSKTGTQGLHNIGTVGSQITSLHNGSAGSDIGIATRGGTYDSIWRSEILSFGRPFDLEEIVIPLGADLGVNDKVTFKVMYDNESSSQTYVVEKDTYPDRIIRLNPEAQGVSNALLEIHIESTTQIHVQLPITFKYKIND